MAKDKKSFILYTDLLSVVEKLVIKDRQDKTNHAGELFLHILKFVNDKNPIPINFIVDMAFEPIKLSLKRDFKKYEVYIEKQKENGKKGGRPRKTQKTQPFLEKPKKADSVSVSDNVIDNEIIDKSITINNKKFISKAINDNQWLEVLAMQNKFKIELVKNKIAIFENHLLSTKKQHSNYKEFASHFSYWLKQNKNNNKAQKLTF